MRSVAVLVRLASDGSSRVETVLSLPGHDVVVGRGAHVSLPLIDASVSREHARIVFDPRVGRWMALSLNPNNPIRVVGRGVEQLELAPGIEFALGQVRLRFESNDPRDKSTVLMDDAAGAAVIAQVKAEARDQAAMTSQPQPQMQPQPRANPFVGDSAPGPVAAAAPPQPTTRSVAATPGPDPSSSPRPESHLVRRRVWPFVVIPILLGVGAAVAVFHETLLASLPTDLLSRGTSSADGGAAGGGGDSAGDRGSDDTLSAAVAPDPNGAMGGWLANGAPDCSKLAEPRPAGGPLGKVLELKGRPTGVMWARDAEGETALVLEYGRDGQQLRFEGGEFRGGTEGPKVADAKPIPGTLTVGQLDADTDPRCIVDQYGPATLLLGGAPLAIDDPGADVPIAWQLARGGMMVTVGPELWVVRLGDESPNGAGASTPVWVGSVASVGAPDQPRAMAVVYEREGGGRTVELLQGESTATRPSLTWATARSPDGAEWVARDDDAVEIYLAGDAVGGPAEGLRAKFGLVDVPEPGRQTRSLHVAFDHGGGSFAYAGTLVRTPWR